MAMETWKKNRWTIFYVVTWIYLILELGIIFLRTARLPHSFIYFKWAIWPEAALGMVVVLSLAQVMQYFLESPRIVAGVYLYAATNFIVVTIAFDHVSDATIGTISLLPLLYYIICLFRVRAPEVSLYFRWIASLQIFTIIFNIVFNYQHVAYSSYLRMIPTLVRLSPYVMVLVMLTRMLHMPPEYVSSFEKEIESIGESTEE